MRKPASISLMLSSSSRSRKQYIITETAPISSAVRAEPHQVAGDALQLGDEHADVVDPLGHLDAEQLLDREAEGQAVRLRAQVVHALDERDDLLPLLLLGGLLDAGVQVADGRCRR